MLPQGLEPTSKNTGQADEPEPSGPFRGPREPELDQFVAALKARGFTAKQIQDITAAAADSGLVELERSQTNG